jgi:ankyrin repeat protein
MCEIIGLLIEYGADVNSRNFAGQTPLSMSGTLQVRERLIKAGGIE